MNHRCWLEEILVHDEGERAAFAAVATHLNAMAPEEQLSTFTAWMLAVVTSGSPLPQRRLKQLVQQLEGPLFDVAVFRTAFDGFRTTPALAARPQTILEACIFSSRRSRTTRGPS